MSEAKRSLDRIERLVEVRQTYVTAAEAAVKEAESIVHYFEDEARENARQIQTSREEIAYLTSLTGHDIQTRERHISSLNLKARRIAQDVEKANQMLEKRRGEWRETMKDKKIVERVQERRLQEWERSVDVLEQKEVDEMSIGRHARDKSHAAIEPDGPDTGFSSSSPSGGRSHDTVHRNSSRTSV
jgi:flagellar export protein FliJ